MKFICWLYSNDAPGWVTVTVVIYSVCVAIFGFLYTAVLVGYGHWYAILPWIMSPPALWFINYYKNNKDE